MKSFLIISIIVLIFANVSCVKPVVIEGKAMSPTFNNGDRILLNTNLAEINRGEVIAFLYPKNTTKWFIKRVIGLPNEKVEIKEGIVFINDEKLEENYVDENNNLSKGNFPPKIVSDGQYFVLGDNRDNSSDSRSWGTVKRDLVQGRYYTTYFHADKNER